MLKTNKLIIKGMHCHSCQALIEAEVGESEGVTAVNVDFENSTGQITFDDAKISAADIAAKIAKLGYRAEKS